MKGLVRAPRSYFIEGYAIVSSDGMIADADGTMDALKFDADKQYFLASLDAAAAVVHGRHSSERRLGAARSHRLVLTRRIAALARDPRNSRALLWNPAGASLEVALCALDVPHGVLAVIGGTDVFGLFLEIGYDSFHLSRAKNVRLPGGRMLFPEVRHEVTPEEMLASRGLKPGPEQVLDAAAGVTLVTWSR
ncbi:MAG: dihydrofolate reductase [Methylocella sp.]